MKQKQIYKIIKMICFLVACTLLLVSCSSCNKTCSKNTKSTINENTNNSDKITIGAVIASDEASYLNNVVPYMIEAAEDLDVELIIRYSNWDSEEQSTLLNQFIKQNVDAIILCPVNAKSSISDLKKAKSANIPVINLNMKVDSISTEYISTYVGSSMTEEATYAANIIIDKLGDSDSEIAIIEGSPGNDAQIYRTQAFMKKISTCQNIEVVALGCGEWDRNTAYEAAKTILEENPNICAIFAHDNNMALGVAKAIEELGKEDDIIVVGIGEDNEEYIQAVKDGSLYAIVTQPPSYEGTYSVYAAVDAANGDELRPWYKDPIEILTKESLNQE